MATGDDGSRVEPGGDARSEEIELVAALRAGDERTFVELVERLYRPLLRVAMAYVRSREIAEEVVQDTWIAVLQGIDRFEQRSSVRSWVFRILTNKAKTRGQREQRILPLSALARTEASHDEAAVDPARFEGPDASWAGHWKTPPESWVPDAEQILLGREVQDLVASVIETLAPAQRLVVTLRDIEGWTSREVRDRLHITAGNQRVLLHRARTKIRTALEEYMREGKGL